MKQFCFGELLMYLELLLFLIKWAYDAYTVFFFSFPVMAFVEIEMGYCCIFEILGE